ncbi:ElyC/SanA/YdcF family protein [Limosilactobacillus fermentum]
MIVKLMLAIYGYVAVLIDAYLLATVINALPLTIKPTKILILGAGLIKGGVGPVLRRRLLGGLALYQRFPKAELIMSGGQGDDEPEPEAVAMHRFARQKGFPSLPSAWKPTLPIQQPI